MKRYTVALVFLLLVVSGVVAQNETPADTAESPPEAELTVIKSVSNDGGAVWDDAQIAPGLAVEEGDSLLYLIQIVNTGDFDLTGLTLTDTLLDTSDCEIPDMLEPGDLTECIVGPVAAAVGQTVNTALVTAQFDGQTITATDSAYAFAGDVALLHIEKMVGTGGAWYSADNAPGIVVANDGHVRFRITVTNDGTEAFTNIVLTDSMYPLTGCDIPVELPAGLSFSCDIGSFEVDDDGAQINTATVTATANGVAYTASDDAHYAASGEDTGAIIIIEGPVTSIDGNIIIIFDTPIVLDINDPLLIVIRIGDIVHVEGTSGENNVVIVVVIIIIDVDIFVGDGPHEIFRDDGQCGNPPPPWAPAHGWRRKCQGTTVTPGALPPGLRNKDKFKLKIKIKN